MEFGTYQLSNIPKKAKLEALDTLDYLGLPNGRYYDEYGAWYPLNKPSMIFGSTTNRQFGKNRYTFWNEQQLRNQRDAARFLTDNDPLAMGVLGQLVNFTVGSEAQIAVTPKRGNKSEGAKQACDIVQSRIDAFKDRMHIDNGYTQTFEEWCREYAASAIVDGEKWDRIYCTNAGAVTRRIEPEQVIQPPGMGDKDGWHMGVFCKQHDITKRLGYYITHEIGTQRGEVYDARDVLQYKRNTVLTVVRGVSDFVPVSDDLADIGRLIDGIRIGAKIKSKIAYIRSFKGGTQSTIEDFVAKVKDNAPPNPTGGLYGVGGSGRSNTTVETNAPGSVVNAGDNMEFRTLPAGAMDEYLNAANFCIRCVLAMRWQLPEYMVNSDASNNNYASIMVAGGPSNRSFMANQSAIASRIKLILMRVLEYDIMLGLLPVNILQGLDIVIKFPSPVVSDPLSDAQVKSIELERKIRSRKSWQMASGLDPEEEDNQILDDQQKFGQMAVPLPNVFQEILNDGNETETPSRFSASGNNDSGIGGGGEISD